MVPSARIVLAVAATAVLGGAAVPARAQDVALGLDAFLRQHLGMSAADLDEARDGRAVVTLPDATDPREFAAAGVVRVNAAPRAFVAAVLDVATYVRGATVHQSGAFSAPPVLADLDAVMLPDADLEALRACRVGRCDVKLPAALLERLQDEAVWSTPDWRQQVNVRVKQWIVAGARAYLRDGYAALPEYVDQALVVSSADETRAMVSASPYVRDQVPEFLEELGRPRPAAPLAGLTRVLYWAVEHHGFKPTLTISEAAIYQRDGVGPVFVATTQLYATHYFEGAITFTVATPAGPGTSTAFDLLYLHHVRLDSLRGGFRGLKRFTASRRIRRRVEAMLLDNKRHVERQAVHVIP